MSIDKKKPDTDPADGVNTAADEAPDLDAVMRKYDRESATRLWEGTPQLIIRILMAAFGLFCIGMTLFSKAMPEIRLTMFVGCIIIIGFLTYPASKHHVRVNYLPWYDIVLMVVGAACFFYFALNAMTLVRLSTRIETVHVIIGVVGILILMELCRRCVGLPILCVAGVLIVYAFINQLSYAGAVNGATLYDALKTIIYKLFYTTSGVIGTPINVCYTYIVLFIIFGAFLVQRRPGEGGCYQLRPVRHGVRLLRGQHRHHRFLHHPHDEEDRLQARVRRRRRGRGLHRRPDHAPHHGCGSLPHGRVHEAALRPGGRQGHPARAAVLHRDLHRRPSGGQEAGPEGRSPRGAACVASAGP